MEVKVQTLVGSTEKEDGLLKCRQPHLDTSTGAGLMRLTTPITLNSRIARANCLHVPGGEIKGQTTAVVVVGVYLPVLPTREVRGHQRTIVEETEMSSIIPKIIILELQVRARAVLVACL